MKGLVAIGTWIACVAVTLGETTNVIVQHNPDLTEGVHYRILQEPYSSITILMGVPNEVFEFEAVVLDNGQYVEPGDINLVTADENAGRVDLTFVGHNGHDYGAANIKEIRLDEPEVTGVTAVIQELNISNNLGDLGNIRAARIEGTCTVAYYINNDVYLQSLLGELWCLGNMQDLTISDPKPGPVGSRIIIGEPYGGGPEQEPYTGTIDVAGDLEYIGIFDRVLGGTVHSATI